VPSSATRAARASTSRLIGLIGLMQNAGDLTRLHGMPLLATVVQRCCPQDVGIDSHG